MMAKISAVPRSPSRDTSLLLAPLAGCVADVVVIDAVPHGFFDNALRDLKEGLVQDFAASLANA